MMRVLLRLFPFRRIMRWFQLTQGASTVISSDQDMFRAARIGRVIRDWAGQTPWHNSCLVQALAGMAMLRRRRIAGTLYLGVARPGGAGSAIAAHAWLCSGEVVLTGAGTEITFTPVASFSW